MSALEDARAALATEPLMRAGLDQNPGPTYQAHLATEDLRKIRQALRDLIAEHELLAVACAHESWEQHGVRRRCADCREHLGQE
jgi:hypothetical protein